MISLPNIVRSLKELSKEDYGKSNTEVSDKEEDIAKDLFEHIKKLASYKASFETIEFLDIMDEIDDHGEEERNDEGESDKYVIVII